MCGVRVCETCRLESQAESVTVHSPALALDREYLLLLFSEVNVYMLNIDLVIFQDLQFF